LKKRQLKSGASWAVKIKNQCLRNYVDKGATERKKRLFLAIRKKKLLG